jgi:hypothetical protein
MDFNSFIKYLTFLRWSRVFAYVFAFIGCSIVGHYLLFEQINHRQLVWEFQNVSHFHTGDMELEPDRIYEVRWERKENKNVVPTELLINGDCLDTENYYQLHHVNLGHLSDLPLYKHITNPMRIRVKKPTTFGIIFRVYTDTDLHDSIGNAIKRWFISWFDPVALIDWTVHDITDSYKNESLLFDGDLFKNSK